jgi:tyrosyl-tRNA synthetase
MTTLSDEQVAAQVAELCGGCEAAYTPAELAARLRSAAAAGRPLRVKLGLDPTAPDIHLGHTVVFRKIRQFQDLGHKAVLIIGDWTARIGDPTGQEVTRPVLSPQEIDANAATYVEQAGCVLDTSPERLEIRRNSEWLDALRLDDILHLASRLTVAQMMQRDTFRKRFAAESPIGVHEFLYPLMQAYDSVRIEADVELGGNDQTFNNLVGRTIQQAYGQPPQIVLVLPILVGLDGVQKMSKSKGNTIGVTDEPNEMFGKVMSIPDALMANYFALVTDTPDEQVRELTDPQRTHPRQAKAALGQRIVARYHGSPAAAAAAEEFDRVFSRRQTPADMPAVRVPAGPMNVVALVCAAAFAKSSSDARRLVQQNAVSVDGEKITRIDAEVDCRPGRVLRVGRRQFARLETG